MAFSSENSLREPVADPLEKRELLEVALNGIERKADVIRLMAGTPPQNPQTKRLAGEILTLVERVKKWV
jgi:hypothetical protein